ncbi:MAG: hypothetical protein CMI01_04800 [Oceanospirillaceae bacterium]|nr:lipoprotein [Marinobacterium litorale]MBS97975.1 hypothetical protein [Oceanospirillaceae bacterium]
MLKLGWPILILSALLVSGCGQKGPLSLPQSQGPVQQAQ